MQSSCNKPFQLIQTIVLFGLKMIQGWLDWIFGEWDQFQAGRSFCPERPRPGSLERRPEQRTVPSYWSQ